MVRFDFQPHGYRSERQNEDGGTLTDEPHSHKELRRASTFAKRALLKASLVLPSLSTQDLLRPPPAGKTPFSTKSVMTMFGDDVLETPMPSERIYEVDEDYVRSQIVEHQPAIERMFRRKSTIYGQRLPLETVTQFIERIREDNEGREFAFSAVEVRYIKERLYTHAYVSCNYEEFCDSLGLRKHDEPEESVRPKSEWDEEDRLYLYKKVKYHPWLVSSDPAVRRIGNADGAHDMIAKLVANGTCSGITDAIKIVKTSASIQIQKIMRGVASRRYVRTHLLWIREVAERQEEMEDFARIWRLRTKRQRSLRKQRRYLQAWKRYFRQVRRRHQLFTGVFWPLYTWRKYTQRKRRAKAKAIWLRKVFHSLILLRTFRAYKMHYLHVSIHRTNMRLLKGTIRARVLGALFGTWKQYAKIKRAPGPRRLRRFGIAYRSYSKRMQVWISFLALRSNTYFAKLARKAAKERHYPSWDEHCADSKDAEEVIPSLEKVDWLQSHIRNRLASGAGVADILPFFLPMRREYLEEYVQERKRLRNFFNVGVRKYFTAWTEYINMRRKAMLAWWNGLKHCKARTFRNWVAFLEGRRAERRQVDETQAEIKRRMQLALKDIVRMDREEQEKEEWMAERQRRRQEIRRYHSLASTYRTMAAGVQTKLLEFEAKKEDLLLCNEDAKDVLDHYRESQLHTSWEKRRGGADTVHKILHYRANAMYKALCTGFDELEQQWQARLRRVCFQQLRSFTRHQKALRLWQKARLRKWVAICVRYKQLSGSAGAYRKLFLMMRFWRKLVDASTFSFTMASGHLTKSLRYRRQQRQRLSEATIGHSKEDLHKVLTTRRVVFLRWIEYTQQSFAKRELLRAQGIIRQWRFLRRTFQAWKFHGATLRKRFSGPDRSAPVNLSSASFYDVKEVPPVPGTRGDVLRAYVDRRRVRQRLMVPCRFFHIEFLRRKHRLEKKKMRNRSLHDETMATKLEKFNEKVLEQARVEQRELFKLFVARRKSEYKDPTISQSVGGSGGTPQTVEVPYDARLKRVEVYVTACIEGFLVIASGGATRNEVVLPMIGKPLGDRREFELGHEEELVAMEVQGDSIVNALRFFTDWGRVSPWIGSVDNLGTKPRLLGSPERYITGLDWYGEGGLRPSPNRIMECFPIPVITGLHCRVSPSGIISLAVVERQYVGGDSNVLRYCWTRHENVSRSGGTENVPQPSPRDMGIEIDVDFGNDSPQVQSQFCSLLRLRICSIRDALVRARNLSTRLRSGPVNFVPTEVLRQQKEKVKRFLKDKAKTGLDKVEARQGHRRASLTVQIEEQAAGALKLSTLNSVSQGVEHTPFRQARLAMGIGRWMFKGLIKGLNCLPQEEDESGRILVAKAIKDHTKALKQISERIGRMGLPACCNLRDRVVRDCCDKVRHAHMLALRGYEMISIVPPKRQLRLQLEELARGATYIAMMERGDRGVMVRTFGRSGRGGSLDVVLGMTHEEMLRLKELVVRRRLATTNSSDVISTGLEETYFSHYKLNMLGL